MSTPVYLLVLGTGYTEAWYRLSKEERAGLWAKVQEVDARAGAIVHLACDSRWCDEEYLMWGVGEYPSMEAYQQKVKELEALEWWRYWTGKTILGTKMDM